MEEVNQLPPYALNQHADEVEQQALSFSCQEQKAAYQFSVPSKGDQEEEAEVEHSALSSWHHEEAEVERLLPICVGHLKDKVDQPGPSCCYPQEEEKVKQPNPSFTVHQMEKEEVKQLAPFGPQNLVIEKSKIVQCMCPDQAITQNLYSLSKTYTISDQFEFSHSNFMD
ncbi:hypothetical protein CHS0354_010978 [Potamilus streckersoni]|uniref:Uncharacterized protein n=1 Tax=Potamilus streckersoni TaxID=2493646 RepID=A0AAE0RQQ9_9BIVA|nr:hypothetical protein CHS0354_010978 [Potamilus streckersoni]